MPDMEFSVAEVEAWDRANRQARRHHRPRPDMVFTEEEASAAVAPAAPTIEQRDAARATPAPAAAPAPAPAPAPAAAAPTTDPMSDLTNTAGAANDVVGALNATRPATAPMVGDRFTGPLATVAGGLQAINSFRQGIADRLPGETDEQLRERRVNGAFGVGVGALGAAGGVAQMGGMDALGGGLSIASGGLEAVQGINNLRSNDLNTQGQGGQQVLHGLLSAGGGALQGTPAGMVMQAGAGGVAVGTAMQQRAEQVSLANGSYQQTRYGRGINGEATTVNVSASDDASIRGAQTFANVNSSLYNLTGNSTISEIGGGVAGLAHTGARSVWNTLTNLW